MLMFTLVTIAVALTCVMMAAKQTLLGFPAAMFWAILGGYCYQNYVILWDTYYLLFFASFGMVILCSLGMYVLRTREDESLDEGEPQYIDEGNGKRRKSSQSDSGEEPDSNDDEFESEPSQRTKELHERANARRTKPRRRIHFGEFK